MSLNFVTSTDERPLKRAALLWAQQKIATGKKVYWICPSSSWAAFRKQKLASGVSLGIEVCTLRDYVKERWDIDGDGKTLISQQLRLLITKDLLDEYNLMYPDLTLSTSADFIEEYAHFLKQSAGCVSLQDESSLNALFEIQSSLSHRERAVLKLSLKYKEIISNLGFIEENEVLVDLKSSNSSAAFVFDQPQVKNIQFKEFINNIIEKNECLCTIQYAQGDVRFLSQQSTYEFLEPLATDRQTVASEMFEGELADFKQAIFSEHKIDTATGAINLAKSKGSHVENALLALCVEKFLEAGKKPKDICLVMPNASLNEADMMLMMEEFALLNIPLIADVPYKFETTTFGVLFKAVFDIVRFESLDALKVFIANPLSGLSQKSSWKLDKTWRKNRVNDTKRCLEAVFRESKHSEEIINSGKRLFSAKTSSEQKECFEQFSLAIQAVFEMQRAEREGLDVSGATSALRLLSRALETATAVGLLYDFSLVGTLMFYQKVESCPVDDGGAVHLLSADCLVPRKTPVLIVSGLTARNYPMDVTTGAFAQLKILLGIENPPSQQALIRGKFYALIESATEQILFEYADHDEALQEQRPSVLLEDALDVYARQEQGDDAEVPEILHPYFYSLSEKELEYVVPASQVSSREQRLRARTSPVYLSARRRGELRDLEGLIQPDKEFSATEIEYYLQCPYKWFFSRRINPGAIDTGFGSIERGQYYHHVLELFYKRFTGQEHAPVCANEKRITPDNIGLAYEILETCAEEYISNNKDRIIPITLSDKNNVQHYKRDLKKFLLRDATYLPKYEPCFFEYQFGRAHQKEVHYAGVTFQGTIDRIDIDPESRYAAVIDYKASNISSYVLPKADGKTGILTSCVQSALYASVAGALLDVKPVASVYRAVLKPEEGGAWDAAVFGDGQAFGLGKRGAVPRETAKGMPDGEPEGFSEYLGLVEEYVNDKLQDLLSGKIEQRPYSEKSCEYCLVKPFCKGVCHEPEDGN